MSELVALLSATPNIAYELNTDVGRPLYIVKITGTPRNDRTTISRLASGEMQIQFTPGYSGQPTQSFTTRQPIDQVRFEANAGDDVFINITSLTSIA